ncbi:MAG: hypothetical protein KDE51_03430 [Anaerolineales bacterium]|nr:hypothetical protein [Anaerolineales bacterium]
MNALRTWMFAGVIALAGGTTAFVALNSTGPTAPTAQTAVLENQNAPTRNNNNNANTNNNPSTAVDDITTANTFQLSFDDLDLTTAEPSVAQTSPSAPLDIPQNTAVVAEEGGQVSAEARAYLQTGVESATANALGLTVEELQAARTSGQPMNELLEAAGLTREELQAAVEAVWPSIVQGAEEVNLVTAAQADTLLENGPRLGRGGGRNRGPAPGNSGGRRNQDGQDGQNRPNRNPPAGQGNNT